MLSEVKTVAASTTANDTLKRKTRDANVIFGGNLVARALPARIAASTRSPAAFQRPRH
jgi:hypothetical protein